MESAKATGELRVVELFRQEGNREDPVRRNPAGLTKSFACVVGTKMVVGFIENGEPES